MLKNILAYENSKNIINYILEVKHTWIECESLHASKNVKKNVL